MVFIGGSPRYLNDQGYFGGFEQGDLDQLFEVMKENYYAWASGFAPLAMGNSDNPQLAERYATTISPIRPDIGLEVSRVIFNSDYCRELSKRQTPSLIIQSQQDIAVPREVALYLRDHLPNSQLSEIEAEGHLPHISKPE